MFKSKREKYAYIQGIKKAIEVVSLGENSIKGKIAKRTLFVPELITPGGE